MKLIPRWIQRPVERALAPVVSGFIKQGVHPNTLTTIGFVIVTGSAVAFGAQLPHLGGFLLLLSGAFDVLDGKVARGGGMISAFGAFYDSTLDRVGEAMLFVGIGVAFVTGGIRADLVPWAVAATTVAMGAALIVSYARARAEGLNLECKVGLAQRAERIIGIGVPMMLFGAGPDGVLLFGVVALLAVFSVITVIQRIHRVYRVTRAPVNEQAPDAVRRPTRVPAFADLEEGSPSERR